MRSHWPSPSTDELIDSTGVVTMSTVLGELKHVRLRSRPTRAQPTCGPCASFPACQWCTVVDGPRPQPYDPPCGIGSRGDGR